jgi:hypothetical protein
MSHEGIKRSNGAGEQLGGEWLSPEESANILQVAKSRYPDTSIALEDRYFHVQIGDGKVLKIPAWKRIDVVIDNNYR